PMMAGSTPAVAQETMRASGVSPRCSACLADISTRAAAPSLMPQALPALTVERGTQLRQRLDRGAVLGVLVGVHHDVALAARHGDRDDLVLEAAGLLRRLGLLLRGRGEGVLVGSRDLPF